jgi:hypothetical protein
MDRRRGTVVPHTPGGGGLDVCVREFVGFVDGGESEGADITREFDLMVIDVLAVRYLPGHQNRTFAQPKTRQRGTCAGMGDNDVGVGDGVLEFVDRHARAAVDGKA